MPFGCGAFFLLGVGRSSSRLGRKRPSAISDIRCPAVRVHVSDLGEH